LGFCFQVEKPLNKREDEGGYKIRLLIEFHGGNVRYQKLEGDRVKKKLKEDLEQGSRRGVKKGPQKKRGGKWGGSVDNGCNKTNGGWKGAQKGEGVVVRQYKETPPKDNSRNVEKRKS